MGFHCMMLMPLLIEERIKSCHPQGFKEMDMDVIGDFRYADDEFKDQDDNLRLVMYGKSHSQGSVGYYVKSTLSKKYGTGIY